MQTRAAFTGLPVVKRATLTVKHFSYRDINRDSLKKVKQKSFRENITSAQSCFISRKSREIFVIIFKKNNMLACCDCQQTTDY